MTPLGNDDALARRALEHYPLECRTLAYLATSDSSVFRVETEAGEAFVLRIHTSASLSAGMLEGEMAWLAALSRADVAFQRPVRTLEGAWVAPLAGTRAAAPWATLLSWAEGSALEGRLNLEQAERAGEVLAKLHLQAEALPPPEERPVYDLAFFRRRWHDLSCALGADLDRLGGAAVMEDAWPALESLVHPVEGVYGGFGLVHGDAHPGNFLEHQGDLRLIDFGRLGWSAYLLDVAYCGLDMEPVERAALLGSYRRARGLSGEVPEPQFKALMYLAALDNLAFLAGRPHEWAFVLEALPGVLRAIANLTAEVNS